MTGYLVAEEGPLSGMIIRLEEETEWILGRDEDVCYQTLEDPMVSRKHVQIRLNDGGFSIENLSSVNPAQLNGQPIAEETSLSEGDTLQIGNTLFRFSEKAPSAQAEDEEPSYTKPGADETRHMNPLDSLSLMSGLDTRWMIKVISGPNTGGEFNLQPGGKYKVGKDNQTCDIVFHDMSVSKEHAELTMQEDGTLILSDMGSKNGLFVNGKKIEGAATLENQDLIAMGTTSFLAIDREATRDTVYTPPPAAPVEEAEKEGELAAQETAGKWKEMRISRNYLIAALAVVVVVVFGIGSVISLFSSKPIKMEEVNESKAIATILEHYPAVDYTYTESTGKLFLAGHVLTHVDKQEMMYLLHTLPYISSIEDNVVVDEVVWSDMNALLSKNPSWRGITVGATKPGQFVVRGYLQTAEQAAALRDYFNLNFPYLDMLSNEIVIENTLETEVRAALIEKGFLNVNFQLTNGELVLAGRVSKKEEVQFEQLTQNFKELRGVRQVKNFVIMTTESTGRIDLTGRFQVTGTSKLGNTSQFVLINGKILAKGDQLDGMTITKIMSNEVQLEKDGLKFKINYNVQ